MSRVPTLVGPIKEAFETTPPAHHATLLALREMIFEVAHADPRIGPIEETLRWGQPAYITQDRKTGSTIRLGIEKASGRPALFFICTTSLVETFRQQFGDTLRYSKNRAVLVGAIDDAEKAALKHCIAAALTYQLKAKPKPQAHTDQRGRSL